LRRAVDGPYPIKLIQTLPRVGYRLAIPPAADPASDDDAG
jgi:DNA-binding winged helix-turn-helix (wHTH) protein